MQTDMLDIPQTQALQSSTFTVPPFHEQTLVIPQLYDWHARKSPEHPVFKYYSPDEKTLKNVLMKDVVRGMHIAAKYVTSVASGAKKTGRLTVAILAASDSITFFTLMLGVLRAGHTVFPISPRNSPAAVTHLLKETRASVLFVGREQTFKELSAEALCGLKDSDEDVKDVDIDVALADMPIFEDLYPVDPRGSDDEFSLPVEFDMDGPAIIAHSSGSTRYPKPITWTHRFLLMLGSIPFFGQTDLATITMGCHTIPMFHSMGMVNMTLGATTGITMAQFAPSTSPMFPNSTSVFEETMLTHTDLVCGVPAFIEAWSRNPEYVEYMKKMKGVMYGGGPLNRQVGDFLASQGVAIYMNYGCTEGGPITTFIPGNPGMDWEYVRPSGHLRPEFVPYDDHSFELVLLEHDNYTPCVINTKLGGRRAYATGDLFVTHPSSPGLWKIYGRADDQIMLSTGEKTNPGPLESIISQDPHVQAAVIFGRGRAQNGVIIDPKTEYAFDPIDEKALAEFRNIIWPTLEKVNEFAPNHSRIFKEMILVRSPSKPFAYTAKNTPRRQPIIASYEPEIDALYETVEKTMQADIPPPKSWEVDGILRFVRATVSSVITAHSDLEDEVDLFHAYACDSLQATWIRNSILHTLAKSKPEAAQRLPMNLVYQCPSIQSLSHFVSQTVLDAPNGAVDQDQVEDKIKELETMVEKYASEFPHRDASVATKGVNGVKGANGVNGVNGVKGVNGVNGVNGMNGVHKGDTILITGTTGGFGCELLEFVLRAPCTTKVYALNRDISIPRKISGLQVVTDLERQEKMMSSHGINVDALKVPNLTFVKGDLSKPMLGLSSELYTEIRDSVTHIFHNAWRVDFNVALTSFESNVAGLRNLIDLALSSPHAELPRLIFVSSIGVFRNPESKGYIPEEPIDDPRVAIGTGYTESKWVGEKILNIASKQTRLRPIIVRFGQLSGARNGYWNEREWFPSVVKSALTLRSLPLLDGTVSWIPPHDAAVVLWEMRNSSHLTLHLVNPQVIEWASLLRPIGKLLDVSLVSYDDWVAGLAETYKDTSISEVEHLRRNPALRLLDFFRNVNIGEDFEPLGTVKLDTSIAVQESPFLKERVRSLDSRDAEKWIESWKRTGYLC